MFHRNLIKLLLVQISFFFVFCGLFTAISVNMLLQSLYCKDIAATYSQLSHESFKCFTGILENFFAFIFPVFVFLWLFSAISVNMLRQSLSCEEIAATYSQLSHESFKCFTGMLENFFSFILIFLGFLGLFSAISVNMLLQSL